MDSNSQSAIGTTIAVIDAAFCARGPEWAPLPGAVRASVGIGVQSSHIDHLIRALHALQEPHH